MNPEVAEGLLKAIRDAVSSSRRHDDDVVLPPFDPATSDSGAAAWCDSIQALSGGPQLEQHHDRGESW